MSYIVRPNYIKRFLVSSAAIVILLSSGNSAHAANNQWNTITPSGTTGYTFNTSAAIGNYVYLGTNHGIYKSSDGGTTFPITGLTTHNVTSIAIGWIYNTGTNVYEVNSSSYVFAGTSDAGVFVSTIGGTSWTATSTGLTDLDVLDLKIDQSQVTQQGSFTNLYVATPSGIFISTTTGSRWQLDNSGLSGQPKKLVTSFTNGKIYALTNGNKVYSSDLYSVSTIMESWSPIFDANGTTTSDISVSNALGNTDWLATDKGIYKSDDADANWASTNVGLPASAVKSIATDYLDQNIAYAAISGSGVYRTTNEAITNANPQIPEWLPINIGLSDFNIKEVKTDPSSLSVAYAVGANGLYKMIYDVSTCGGDINTCVENIDLTPPSTVTDLSGSPIDGTSVLLTWTAPGNNGVYGTATSYDIRYSTSPINDSNWSSATAVAPQPTPRVSGTAETYNVYNLNTGTAYYFALKSQDGPYGGPVVNQSALSNVVSVTPSASTATTYTFTGPSSGNVGSASTNFTVTPNAAYTGTITLTPSGAGSTGLSATTLTFSNSSTAQTFTITPTTAGSITLTPTNNQSLTNPANLSYTANAVVPGAPTIGTATAGNAQATISFTAPASNGGSTITSYTVTSNSGSHTGTGSASPITVTGLTNGTAYTFTVTAHNSVGTGSASSASNSVTPTVSTATTYTFTGPSSGNAGSASSNFIVTPNAAYTGTITLTPSGAGSTGLSATTLTFSNSSTAQTFTITPTVSGSITLTPTNNGSLTNPANLSYTANAVSTGGGGGGGGSAPTYYILTITKQGTGQGTATSTPAGISCGTLCSSSFIANSSIILNTVPKSGSHIASWTGCTSIATSSCTVTLSAAKNITINFALGTSTAGVVNYQAPTANVSTPSLPPIPIAYAGLGIGSTGYSVLGLQNFLISQGYLASIYNTGYYGSLTDAAVKKYIAAVVALQQSPVSTIGGNTAGVTSTTTTSYPYYTSTFIIGTRSADITALQTYLSGQGYMSSQYITGYYGPITSAALAKYKSDITAKIGVAVQCPFGFTCTQQLPASPSITPAPITSITFTRSLTIGSTGADVLLLQKTLNSLGYTIATTGNGSPGHESTYFGPATESTLGRYQCAKGIVCSGDPGYGLFGPRTIASIEGKAIPPATTISPAKTTTVQTPTPTSPVVQPSTPPSAPSPITPPVSNFYVPPTTNVSSVSGMPLFTVPLTAGSTGKAVKNLQIFLNDLGFTVNETQTYDAATIAAVKRFQSAYASKIASYGGGAPNGIFDDPTMEAANGVIAP